MGLSIHYSGTIRNLSLIPGLAEEVKDTCNILQWTYHEINDSSVNGVVFYPENCEPLFLTFSPNGELFSPVLLQHKIEPATVISVKTQYAGIKAHKAIIELLKHLSAKYFSAFHLDDEGKYWETNDATILQQQFNNYEAALNFTIDALSDMKAKENETPQSLAERIMKRLNKGNGDSEDQREI